MNASNEQSDSIRRVLKQSTEATLKEFDRLYDEIRKKDTTADMQKSRIVSLENENLDLMGDIRRAEFSNQQSFKSLGVSVICMIVAWICTGIAIGYAVWVG